MIRYYWIYVLIFTLLKILNVISFSWWWLILPIIFYYTFYILMIIITLMIVGHIIGVATKDDNDII